MNDHRNRSLVTSTCMNIAASTASTAIITQRPGCRTGTALIGSGRARSVCVGSVIADGVRPSGSLRGR